MIKSIIFSLLFCALTLVFTEGTKRYNKSCTCTALILVVPLTCKKIAKTLFVIKAKDDV